MIIRKYNGAVALTTVIVLTSILMFTGITIVLTSIDLRKSSRINNGFVQAKINSNSCIEESVQRMKYNPAYTGGFTLTLINGSCEATVTDDVQPSIKLIQIDSISDSSTYSATIHIDISVYPFHIIE